MVEVFENEAGKGDIRVSFSHGGETLEMSIGEESDYCVAHLGPETAIRLAGAILRLAATLREMNWEHDPDKWYECEWGKCPH